MLKPQGVQRTAGKVDDFYVIVANVPGVNGVMAELTTLSRKTPESSSLGDGQLLVQVTLDGSEIDRVLAQPLVIGISHVPRLALSDERAAMSMTRNVDSSGAPTNPTKYKDWLAAACPYCTNLAAEGFSVAIADFGLDGGVNGPHHADLPAGRVRYGTDFDSSDPVDPTTGKSPCSVSVPCQDVNGHGTMVAGIVAGNPASGSSTDVGGFMFGTGIAPSAEIFVSKIDLRRTTLTAVKDAATDARLTASPPVFIQNHSYNQYIQNPNDQFDPSTGLIVCTPVQRYDGLYSIMSSLFDRAVKDADQSGAPQPITLTVSSGNQFPSVGSFQCSDNRLTLPPATAKNVLSVGGAENARGPTEQWGCQAATWAGISADSYKNAMGGGRHGTRYANYFKPDLMAPASNIASLRSSSWVNGGQNSNALCNPSSGGSQPPPFSQGNGYLASSGTSFAAPAGAGAALLASRVYAESLLQKCATSPSGCNAGAASPALLKAMLIMSARSMLGGEDRAIAPVWTANRQNRIGDLVRPTQSNGRFYRALTNASSALDEPTPWATSPGSETTDGGQRWVENGSTAIGKLPNAQQGFGRIDLEDLLSDYPARHYVNDDLIPDPNGTPWTKSYQVHDPTLPVKVVLTWTDDPALANEPANYAGTVDPQQRVLVNDLNLSVEVGNPCTTRYIGNLTTVAVSARGEESVTDINCTASAYDSANNVEWIKFFPSVNGATQFTVKIIGAQSMNQRFALVVYNAFDSSGTPPPAKPANLVARGNPTASVLLTWNTVQNAAGGYDIRRRSSGGSFPTLVGKIDQTPSPQFTDSSVSTGTAYVYLVRARNGTGVSGDSAEFASTIAFTDDPIVAGVTPIKEAHVSELRSAVNAVRGAVGLLPFAFTPIDATRKVKQTHVAQMRAALDEARAVVLLPPAAYTDPSLMPGVSTVKAVHVNEIRGGVQ